MGVHVFPHPEPPSHLPPHPIPLGHPSAPAPSTLSHALYLDWRFISHMIIYMFQCHSPISSHPCPFPQSPKDCSIHLCLFCCLAYRVIVTIFLNICISILYWCFSFWLTSLCIMGSSFIHLIRTDSNAFLFIAEFSSSFIKIWLHYETMEFYWKPKQIFYSLISIKSLIHRINSRRSS